MPVNYDVFICHASEDKQDVARPLAVILRSAGLKVWYDEFTLTVGDSLRECIEKGLAESKFGVVILSPAFFLKNWPKQELNGLFARELVQGKVILPVWHCVDASNLVELAPILADKYACRTLDGLDKVAKNLLDVIEPGVLHFCDGEQVVSVVPREFEVGWDNAALVNSIVVTNSSQHPVFGVWVKIQTSDGQRLATEVAEANSSVKLPCGDADVFGDAVIVNARGADGREAMFVRLSSLEPYTSRTVTVVGRAGLGSSTAIVSVCKISNRPVDLFAHKPGQVALGLAFPEDGWQVLGMKVKVDGNSSQMFGQLSKSPFMP